MLDATCAAPTAGCCTPGAAAQATLDAYLDDYACLANALVTLYEADFDERWIDEARRAVPTSMLRLFADPSSGGFFFTAADHEALIARQKDLYDNAVPSGNSMAALALVAAGKADRPRPIWLRRPKRTLRGRDGRHAASAARDRPNAVGARHVSGADARDRHRRRPATRRHGRGAGERSRIASFPTRSLACRAPDQISQGSAALGRSVRRQAARRTRAGRLHLRALRLPGAGVRLGCCGCGLGSTGQRS